MTPHQVYLTKESLTKFIDQIQWSLLSLSVYYTAHLS